jgi:hypothetical protein
MPTMSIKRREDSKGRFTPFLARIIRWNLGAGGSFKLTSGKLVRKYVLDLGNPAPFLRSGSAQNFIRFLMKSMVGSSLFKYSRYWSVASSTRIKSDRSISFSTHFR